MRQGEQQLLIQGEEETNGCAEKFEAAVHIQKAVKAIKSMTCLQLTLVLIYIFMVIGGNGGQLIFLNMWLNNFAKYTEPRPFTVLTLSALTNAMCFGFAVLVRIIIKRPNMRFLLSFRGFALTVAVGFCNASNGVFLVYATGSTPEVLQAMLLATQVFWTILFSKLFLGESRSYCAPAVGVAAILSAGGIILGASSQFTGGGISEKQKYWTLIFAGSIVPGAMYNVFASKYMRSFTLTAADYEEADEENPESPIMTPQLVKQKYPAKSDDATVKMTMLCTTGFSQVFWMFVYFPLDSAPWFGTCSSAAESRSALSHGWKCVFDNDMCRNNWLFFVLFNFSYFLNYIGSAYLNHFSAALCSMVTQLSSPLTALLLIAVPAWNVDHTSYALGPAIGGAIMLLCGSMTYASWEQGSREREEMERISRGESKRSVAHAHDYDPEEEGTAKVWY